MVLAEEGYQHLRPGRADDRMSARVGGVRGGVADLGKPIRVSLGFRVTIRSGSPDRGHWSPEIVRVFGIVEGDHAVGETQIKQGKEPSVLCGRQVVRYRRGLSDLVPVVLNGPHSKNGR